MKKIFNLYSIEQYENSLHSRIIYFSLILLFLIQVLTTSCNKYEKTSNFLADSSTTNLNIGEIKFTKDSKDESASNLPCYKIETPSATYYLEKQGFGISSLIDNDGNDWISFSPIKGTKAKGEYRGIPNAVFRQDGNFFHPLNSGTELSTSKVVSIDNDKVSITGLSSNGTWECRWDFYLTHATFTMTKMPDNYKYWILYEGTPGGSYEDSDWWMTSDVTNKTPMTTNHEGDIPDLEWIAFGDKNIERSLFLYHHEDDDFPDKFYQMRKSMTVFGFGREKANSYLDCVPQTFSIGFLETDEHSVIGDFIRKSFMLK